MTIQIRASILAGLAIMATVVSGPAVGQLPLPDDEAPILPDVPSKTPRAPITILSNMDFNAANGVLSGTGTPTDPYIIQNWAIVGGAAAGIFIANTDAHVVVRGNELLQPAYLPPFVICNFPTWGICTHVGTTADDSYNWLEPGAPFVMPPGWVGLRTWNAANVHFESNSVDGYPYGVVVETSTAIDLTSNVVSPPSRLGYAVRDELVNASRSPMLRDLRDTTCDGLVNCPLQKSVIPIDDDAAVIVRDSQALSFASNVLHGFTFGAKLHNSQAAFEGNTLSGNYFAFLAWAGSQATFHANIVEDNAAGWFACGPETYVLIQENQIVGNNGAAPFGMAIMVDGGDPYCGPGVKADILGNLIANNTAGIWTTDAPVLIEGNEIVGQTSFGLYQQGDPIRIRNNRFVGNEEGAILRQLSSRPLGTSEVSGNSFEGNLVDGAFVVGQEKPVFRNNTFVDNARYGLVNTDQAQFNWNPTAATIPVDARWNWWGSDDGPGSSIYGEAIVDPWLTRNPVEGETCPAHNTPPAAAFGQQVACHHSHHG